MGRPPGLQAFSRPPGLLQAFSRPPGLLQAFSRPSPGLQAFSRFLAHLLLCVHQPLSPDVHAVLLCFAPLQEKEAFLSLGGGCGVSEKTGANWIMSVCSSRQGCSVPPGCPAVELCSLLRSVLTPPARAERADWSRPTTVLRSVVGRAAQAGKPLLAAASRCWSLLAAANHRWSLLAAASCC